MGAGGEWGGGESEFYFPYVAKGSIYRFISSDIQRWTEERKVIQQVQLVVVRWAGILMHTYMYGDVPYCAHIYAVNYQPFCRVLLPRLVG